MLSGLSWEHILRRHVGGRPGIGSWAARIGFYLGGISQYLGISHLIGPVVGRAGTTDKWKPGTWVDLLGFIILAGGCHASNVKVFAHNGIFVYPFVTALRSCIFFCLIPFARRRTRPTCGIREYWTEVG